MNLARDILDIAMLSIVTAAGAVVLVTACWCLIREMIGLARDNWLDD